MISFLPIHMTLFLTLVMKGVERHFFLEDQLIWSGRLEACLAELPVMQNLYHFSFCLGCCCR
jgi:hypothetical protein